MGGSVAYAVNCSRAAAPAAMARRRGAASSGARSAFRPRPCTAALLEKLWTHTNICGHHARKWPPESAETTWLGLGVGVGVGIGLGFVLGFG